MVGGRAADWEDAYAAAADALRGASGVVFLGSPLATVEDNHLLARLADAVGAETPRYLARRQEGSGDGWLVSDDPAPNTEGVERLGFQAVDPVTLAAQIASADVVYILHDDPVAAGLAPGDLQGKTVILHPTHTTNETLPLADVVLPVTMSVETLGTYVNEDGRAQLLRPAKMIRALNRSLMMASGVGMGRPDRVGTPFDRWHDEDNKVDCLPGLGRPPRDRRPPGQADARQEPPAGDGRARRDQPRLRRGHARGHVAPRRRPRIRRRTRLAHLWR